MINAFMTKTLDGAAHQFGGGSLTGLVCLAIIGLACAYNIYSNWVDDTIADRVFYWAMLLTSLSAVAGYFSGKGDGVLMYQTVIVLVAVRFVSNILEHVIWNWFRGGNKRKE